MNLVSERPPPASRSAFPGRNRLQPRTSSGASGQSPPNWHTANDSAWARRLRAERQRSRHAHEHSPDDPPTAELEAKLYDQPTSDVEPDAAQPRPTFAPRPPLAASDRTRQAPIEPRQITREPLVDRIAATPSQIPPVVAFPETPPPVVAAPPLNPSPMVAAAPPESPPPLAREITSGSVLGNRYLLGRLLGAGGGALIFQAEDRERIGAEDFGNKIAIKVLRPEMRHNAHALTRLKREFRQMQRLSHPGVAQVFELACDEDIWFMTMELIDGQTINQWLKSSTSRTAALQLVSACCEALAHAHDAGVVHGDLKPSNVLVLPNGGVKLVDFGSAAERDASTGEVDSDRSFAATPPYASPQVLAGEIAEPRDDVFSLACLTYAVLTHGEHPFDRKSSAEAQAAQMKPAYSRVLLPRQFDVLVHALSWNREQRFASVREFLHALLASDLRRDPAREHVALADVVSDPIPTRDAPTINAGSKNESVSVPPHVEPTVEPRAEASAVPASAVKQEDIARLKAAVAAAEAHAAHFEQPAPAPEKPRHEDPLARFRGYVAGPMANQADDIASDDIVPVPMDIEPPSAPPKTAKRVWPWQRSAWLLAIAAVGAAAFGLSQLDVKPEPIARANARVVAPVLPPPVVTAPPADVAPVTATPAVVEEKKKPADVKRSPAAAPGEVSFLTRTLHVGVGQTMAALTIKRSNSTRGRARIAWTIEGGTARAGVDYQTGASQTIEFLEGQSVRSLFIPLVAEKESGAARQSKTFTVKLQPTQGGPKLGEIRQVYVTIVGDVTDERVARSE